MAYRKKCVVCGRWFDTKFEHQTSCDPECRKEFIRRYRKEWDKGEKYQKYQKRYRQEHSEELSRKSVVRVRNWREKNKRKYLIQTNGNKCGGKWVDVMQYYEWKCAECDESAQLVHHIDKNSANNSKKNLIALCRACHCKEHSPHNFHKT